MKNYRNTPAFVQRKRLMTSLAIQIILFSTKVFKFQGYNSSQQNSFLIIILQIDQKNKKRKKLTMTMAVVNNLKDN